MDKFFVNKIIKQEIFLTSSSYSEHLGAKCTDDFFTSLAHLQQSGSNLLRRFLVYQF